jgi:hypothetical protein
VLSQTIGRARSGLVQELVEVFHVVEVGGRPAVDGQVQEENGLLADWFFQYRETLDVPYDYSLCQESDHIGHRPVWVNAYPVTRSCNFSH